MALLVPLEQVTIRALIRPFLYLAGAVVAYGMVYSADKIVRALFGSLKSSVGWIPWAGKVISAPIDMIERKLTNSLGEVIDSLEETIGTYYHALAQLVTQIGDAIEELAIWAWKESAIRWTYEHARGLIHSVHALQTRVQALEADVEALARHGAVAIPKAAHTASTYVTRVEKVTSAALDRAIAVDIPNLWERTRSEADQLDRLWRWARAHGKTIGEGVGLAAVTAALTRLGLGWLRCNNVGKAARSICRTDVSLLEDLLLGTLAIFGVLSVREFARGMVDIEDEALDLARRLIREWPS